MRNWFSMKVVEDDEEDPDKKKNPFAEIMIFDAIGTSFFGEPTVSAKSFIDGLAELGDVPEIKLRINSPGGDVFDGVAIYNALKNHKAKVTAHVDGLAASAASFVAMAADHIVMPSNSFMLVHNASGFAMGQADDMRAVASDLDRIDKSMTATYVARTGQSAARVRSLMKEDRLMDAAEAKELGFTDEVSKPVKLAANYSLALLPKAAAERFRAETGKGQGDPPQPAPEPQKPEGQPVVPPVSPPPPQPQPSSSDREAAIQTITDLCVLANAPARIAAYVRANTPVDQVRKELLDLRADASVLPHHPVAPQKTADQWGKITDKINARAKK
jgi:ATP-dependent Clp endopeptidase proteolytic subunit ClpP